ncbi:MAG: Na/Pi symporter [Firmicutes bacterium]|nr:Na/Pi symporter [Bacillota bacterium]MCL1953589.1 Na/Pi symporter [Bacillota bacterium]
MQILIGLTTLLTGLGIFMSGVIVLRQSLNALVQGKLKHAISQVGRNRYIAASTGVVAAASMQSSGAVTTLAIGLVDNGALSLFGASAIILGANIGSTILGLAAASGILEFGSFLGIFSLVGSLVFLLSQRQRTHYIGQIFIGFGLLFVGMQTMSNAFGSSAIAVLIGDFLANINFMPIVIVISALSAGLLQSSSAIVALSITMVASNTITLYTALYIVLGADIGTCVVGILASIGASRDAKRTAIMQLLFNIFGVILFAFLLSIFAQPIVYFLKTTTSTDALAVAIFHLMFNLVTVIIALPLLKPLIAIVCQITGDNFQHKSKIVKY